MNTPEAHPRWFHAWGLPRGFASEDTAPSQPDFADLGTAFGLDMSLRDLDEPGLGGEEGPRRTSDEGLEGADDPCRAWVR